MNAAREQPPAGPCLVTGATGLVGNNVVRQLLARGHTVRVLVRQAGRTLDGLAVEQVVGDLRDPVAVEQAVAGAAAVIHAAAMVHVGWRHGAEMHEANVEGAARVARAARAAGARLVHVSSVDALGLRPDGLPADEETPPGGMPECPYVVTKRAAEQAVLAEVERGLDAVIVNPVYMLGPWDWKPSSGRMLLEVGAGKAALAPPGANDFVDVRDVAAGILAALDRGRCGRRYILGGHGLSYLDAWRLFARVTGRRPPLGTAPRAAVRLAGWAGDLAGLFRRREPVLNSAAARAALVPHNFSCRRAVEELGYAFRPLEETAAEAWAWFVAHGYARPTRQGSA